MKAQIWTTLVTCLMISAPALAFQTVSESGDLTAPGTFKLGVEPQIRLTEGSGGNIGVFAESGINDEWSWRGQIGTGDTDFWVNASAKWIPIPDYESQPAIGLRMDVGTGRDNSENFTVFRLAPLVSKGFDTDIGRITPYAAVPIGIFATKGDSDTFSNFVIGSEGKFEQVPGYMFSAELGFNMSKSFSYIAGTATYFFDDSGNSPKKRQ